MCEVHVPLDQSFEAQKADFFSPCDFFVHNVSEGRFLLASHKGGNFFHLCESLSLSPYGMPLSLMGGRLYSLQFLMLLQCFWWARLIMAPKSNFVVVVWAPGIPLAPFIIMYILA
jgi:hypothetical protein